jgi:transposase
MRVVGVGVSRTVAEIAYLEHGRVHSGGRVGVERSSLQRFAKGLRPTAHVVLEATGNTAAIVET